MNKKFLFALLFAPLVVIVVISLVEERNLLNYFSEESGLAVATETVYAVVGNPPSTLSIPKLEVNARVEALGVTKTGNMAAPDNFTNVSWYKFGTVPGEVGSAVMAGHDNGIFVRGVFKRLNEIKVGDDVYITKENGEKLHFKVVEIAVYPYDQAPLEKIFTRKDGAYLNLITCTGKFIKAIGSSDHRLVVYTELVK